jgi:pimeloyl-ACP methyl ester carboxylesterase/DNA-binding CsgD family transcriptional regulator
MNSPPMQYVKTSDGVRIAYISVGDGPALVFASNIFGEARHEFLDGMHVKVVTERLVRLGWRVVRYDVRGMGASDRNVEDLSLDGRVLDLNAVVGQLGFKRFALGGLDSGAATAIAYAARNPASLSHLVLQSPWPSGARYFSIPELRVAIAGAATTDDREWKVFAQILASVALGFGNDLGQGTAAFLQTTSPSGFAAFNRATACIDLAPLLPQVTTPTLVIHEPAFPFGSFELCQEVAAGIRGARFVVVNDNSISGRVHDGHVAAIDAFLRSGKATIPTPVPVLPPAGPALAPCLLTPREAQVLRSVAAGSTNKEIAADLSVAVSTVERHLVNLYTKIGARGRADAIAYAFRHQLDTPPA